MPAHPAPCWTERPTLQADVGCGEGLGPGEARRGGLPRWRTGPSGRAGPASSPSQSLVEVHAAELRVALPQLGLQLRLQAGHGHGTGQGERTVVTGAEVGWDVLLCPGPWLPHLGVNGVTSLLKNDRGW